MILNALGPYAVVVGLAIIVSLLLGALVGGGLVLAGVVIPLYSRLRRANKAAAAPAAAPAPDPRPGPTGTPL